MKRKVPAAVAKSILAKVPFQVSFWLCTNENLRSLSELSAALERADGDVFRYHVNRGKNDFEVWIREILKDKDLAREIARVKTKETLVRKISERIEELESLVRRSRRSGVHKKYKKHKRHKRHTRKVRKKLKARHRRQLKYKPYRLKSRKSSKRIHKHRRKRRR